MVRIGTLRPIWIVVLLIAICPGFRHATAAGQSSATVSQLLDASARYLQTYQEQFGGVVSEERYEQTVHGPKGSIVGHRILRSDLLLVNSGRAGWLCFRDVFEVDGKPVRDRTTRLMDLFVHPSADSVEQATRIREEGARYNIGGVTRTINDPTLALLFLGRDNQPRSTFALGSPETVAHIRAETLRFNEQSTPRLIHTADNSPASGRFWIDSTNGRVIKTELEVSSENARGVVTVEYAAQAKLDGLWVPVRMLEHHNLSTTQMIECVATYTNFRHFDVTIGDAVPDR